MGRIARSTKRPIEFQRDGHTAAATCMICARRHSVGRTAGVQWRDARDFTPWPISRRPDLRSRHLPRTPSESPGHSLKRYHRVYRVTEYITRAVAVRVVSHLLQSIAVLAVSHPFNIAAERPRPLVRRTDDDAGIHLIHQLRRRARTPFCSLRRLSIIRSTTSLPPATTETAKFNFGLSRDSASSSGSLSWTAL